MVHRARTLREFLGLFPVVSRVSVHWGEMDAMRRVGYIHYIRYQESARLRYFTLLVENMIKLSGSSNEMKRLGDEFVQGRGLGPILSDTGCKYDLEGLSYPDNLVVGASIPLGCIGNSRMVMKHGIWSMMKGKVVAEGMCTIVSFDYREGKPKDFHPALVAAAKDLTSRNTADMEGDIVATMSQQLC